MKKLKRHYLKEIIISNSFSFEDKDPRFTRLKPVLSLKLHSKGLFYIRAMPVTTFEISKNSQAVLTVDLLRKQSTTDSKKFVTKLARQC